MSAPAAPAAVAVVPPINADSSTATVAAWCLGNGLRASVVGRWVWVPYYQLHVKGEALQSLMAKGLGWRASKRRQSWFHECGVAPTNARRVTGKLERYHRTISVQDYAGKRGPWSWFAKGRSSGGGGVVEEVTP